MGKRKITVLESAVVSMAEVSWFIESKGLPDTAKKFINEAFAFFEKLDNEKILYRICTNANWKKLGYRCVSFKKKYIIAYLATEKEIIICEFASAKLLRS